MLACGYRGGSGRRCSPVGIGEHTLRELTDDFLGHAWPVTRANNDNAVILHTSRTAGGPRRAQLTHSNLLQ